MSSCAVSVGSGGKYRSIVGVQGWPDATLVARHVGKVANEQPGAPGPLGLESNATAALRLGVEHACVIHTDEQLVMDHFEKPFCLCGVGVYIVYKPSRGVAGPWIVRSLPWEVSRACWQQDSRAHTFLNTKPSVKFLGR